MSKDKSETVRCECADDLNFGEPQPDCIACHGSGRRPKDGKPHPGPSFSFDQKKK
jgi:hypothetical protein